MLRTVEATFDPASGVHFMEPVRIKKPVRVLVTFMEPGGPVASSHNSGSAALEHWLNSSSTVVSDRTPEDMDRYIQELRSSWDS